MLKQLKEKQRSLITRADEILAEAKTQNRELTDAEAQELAEIRDNVKFIKDRIELIGDVEGLDRECGDKPAAAAAPVAEDKKEEDAEVAKREERSFEAFIRGNAMQLRDDASTSPLTKTANGSIVPKTIAKRVIRKLYDICPILERSTKYNVKGNLAIPYYDEDENARQYEYGHAQRAEKREGCGVVMVVGEGHDAGQEGVLPVFGDVLDDPALHQPVRGDDERGDDDVDHAMRSTTAAQRGQSPATLTS